MLEHLTALSILLGATRDKEGLTMLLRMACDAIDKDAQRLAPPALLEAAAAFRMRDASRLRKALRKLAP